MNKFDVLVRPLLSEKSNRSREDKNQYSFRVHLDATKADVTKAVEAMFGVKVKAVRTAITRGKVKRRGAITSKGANAKKAVVTLAEGAKIDLFSDL